MCKDTVLVVRLEVIWCWSYRRIKGCSAITANLAFTIDPGPRPPSNFYFLNKMILTSQTLPRCPPPPMSWRSLSTVWNYILPNRSVGAGEER